MAQPTQMRPSSPEEAPDPSNNYERSHPEREAGMGRLDNNTGATPANQADGTPQAVGNAQDPTRQLNAHDVVDAGAAEAPSVKHVDKGPRPGGGPAATQPDHSMKEEEPDGWDLAPNDIHDPRSKRHPKPHAQGGTD